MKIRETFINYLLGDVEARFAFRSAVGGKSPTVNVNRVSVIINQAVLESERSIIRSDVRAVPSAMLARIRIIPFHGAQNSFFFRNMALA